MTKTIQRTFFVLEGDAELQAIDVCMQALTNDDQGQPIPQHVRPRILRYLNDRLGNIDQEHA